jgi:hypothetical protein
MIRNLTPHSINLRAEDGTDTVIPPDPQGPARVTSTPGIPTAVNGIPVPVWGADTFGEVQDLPAPATGVFLVVSALVGGALVSAGVSRPDVLLPGTGPADGPVRNDKGHIVAVTRLKRATA